MQNIQQVLNASICFVFCCALQEGGGNTEKGQFHKGQNNMMVAGL